MLTEQLNNTNVHVYRMSITIQGYSLMSQYLCLCRSTVCKQYNACWCNVPFIVDMCLLLLNELLYTSFVPRPLQIFQCCTQKNAFQHPTLKSWVEPRDEANSIQYLGHSMWLVLCILCVLCDAWVHVLCHCTRCRWSTSRTSSPRPVPMATAWFWTVRYSNNVCTNVYDVSSVCVW